MRRYSAIGFALSMWLMLAGCALDGKTPTLELADVGATSATAKFDVSSIELYTRIAQGAVSCWFGARGLLKGRYIYHAEAEPASRGGKSEITIHIRQPLPNVRGKTAFRIDIMPSGEQAEIAVRNVDLPPDVSTFLMRDIEHWAAGQTACSTPPPETARLVPSPWTTVVLPAKPEKAKARRAK